MEGTLQFLLLTLLATAATARFEYNGPYVIDTVNLLRKHNYAKYDLHNSQGIVDWILAGKTANNIRFIANPRANPEANCNEMPALTLHEGPSSKPLLCLAQLDFTITSIDGFEVLSLALGFGESEEPTKLRTVFFDLWKKPRNEDLIHPDVIETDPTNAPEPILVDNNQYRIASTLWLDTLFGTQIRKLPMLPRERPKKQPMMKGFPVIMNPETLDRILALESGQTLNADDMGSFLKL